MKNLMKRMIALIMLMTICVTSIYTPVYAQTSLEGVPRSKVYEENGFKVTMSLSSYWNGGYNADIKIENTTDTVKENWYLGFEYDDVITNIWNAEIVTNENGYYVIKNAIWNQDIAPKSYVQFGISSNEDFKAFPAEINILGASVEVSKDDYLVDYKIDNDWGSGFVSSVSITNIGEETIEDWLIEFSYDREITNIWNGTILLQEGNHYIIKNSGYNANIYVGQSVEFGFNGCAGTEQDAPYDVKIIEYSVIDGDGDNIPDTMEETLGTEIYDSDSDNDGLTDFEEFFKIGSDPLKYDSVEKGVSDSQADKDGDGIKNLIELSLGTEAYNVDTDEDGLSDGDEFYKYESNPLVADTDNDGVIDGNEIILGTNPNDTDTDKDLIVDGEEFYNHIIGYDQLVEELLIGNVAIPEKIEIWVQGKTVDEVNVQAYKGHLLGDESVYIGKPLEISNAQINGGNISFKLSEDYIVSDYEIYGEHTNGILICYNDGMSTIPLETEYDESTRIVSANIKAEGTYFIVDYINWIETMGIDIEAQEELSVELMTLADVSIADIKIKGQVDIVFIVDTTGSMSGAIDNVKNNISEFVDEIEDEGINASMALVDYRDITCDGRYSTHAKNNGNSVWFTDVEQFKNKIAELSINGGGDTPETTIDALEFARRLEMRENSQKFFVVITDAGYKIDNNYGLASMQEAINLLKLDGINVSVISSVGYKNDYEQLFNSTFGVFGNINGNFKNELLNVAKKITEETNDGYWIALYGLLPRFVKLDAKPCEGSTADTDGDCLYDIEELWIDTQINYHNISTFSQYLLPTVNFKQASIPMYMYFSNPTEVDTDKDNVDDCEESIIGTSELNEDTDGDKLSDGKELEMWFDPLNKNYDDDSYNDYSEWKNGTSPFVYNMNSKESRAAFIKGGLLGDFVTADSIEMLLGQIVFSFTPLVADARDFVANIFFDFDGWAALANVGGFALDFTGVLGATADVTKAVSKLGEFVIRYADDAPKVVEAIVQGSKHFPEGDEVISALVKVIPASAVDDMVSSIKNGDSIAKADYDELYKIVKAAGKNTDELTKVTKFKSFKSLKAYLGNAGEGKQWHHIVEQCQAKSTRSKFDISDINSVENVIATPNEVHKEISRYYSSKQDFTDGKRFRDWLNGKSFDEQMEYGLKIWKQEMERAGYSY